MGGKGCGKGYMHHNNMMSQDHGMRPHSGQPSWMQHWTNQSGPNNMQQNFMHRDQQFRPQQPGMHFRGHGGHHAYPPGPPGGSGPPGLPAGMRPPGQHWSGGYNPPGQAMGMNNMPGNQMGNQMGNHMGNQMGNQMGNHMNNQMGNHMGMQSSFAGTQPGMARTHPPPPPPNPPGEARPPQPPPPPPVHSHEPSPQPNLEFRKRFAELRRQNPNLEVPSDMWKWSLDHVEAYFKSNGLNRPGSGDFGDPKGQREPEARQVPDRSAPPSPKKRRITGSPEEDQHS